VILSLTSCGGSGSSSSSPGIAVTSLQVTPSAANIVMGHPIQLTATATYQDGTRGDITATATWTTSNKNVATVNEGFSAGRGVGTATIKVSQDSASASVSAQVTGVVTKYAYTASGGRIIIYDVDSTTGAMSNMRFTDTGYSSVSLLRPGVGQHFGYVTVADTDQQISILTYAIDNNSGNLMLVGQPVPLATNPYPAYESGVGVDPLGRFLYAQVRNVPGFYMFSIDSVTGQLTAVQGSPLFPSDYHHLALHPNGKYIYDLSSSGNTLLTVGANGITGSSNLKLTAPPQGVFDAGISGPQIDPSGSVLYMLHNCFDNPCPTDQYKIDPSSGGITYLGNLGRGRFSVLYFHPSGALFYDIAGGLDPVGARCFAVDLDTLLASDGGGFYPQGIWPAIWNGAISLDPGGNLLYLSDAPQMALLGPGCTMQAQTVSFVSETQFTFVTVP
jgi:hypothetical protein